jgi:hypothetical protein
MTDGEKMVWAAVFAAHWDRQLFDMEHSGARLDAGRCAREARISVQSLRDYAVQYDPHDADLSMARAFAGEGES